MKQLLSVFSTLNTFIIDLNFLANFIEYETEINSVVYYNESLINMQKFELFFQSNSLHFGTLLSKFKDSEGLIVSTYCICN